SRAARTLPPCPYTSLFRSARRRELVGSPVGVTVVHPGGIATAIASSARVPAGVNDAELQARLKRTEKLLRMRRACSSASFTPARSEEHTSELQSRENLVCR